MEPAKGERRARHIWIYEKHSLCPAVHLLCEVRFSPRWSPDSKQLAFLSDRDDQTQIYATRADSGEGSALTKESAASVVLPGLLTATDRLSRSRRENRGGRKKEKIKTTLMSWTKRTTRRLWLLTLESAEAEALTEPKWVREAVWHPSGAGLMLNATDHPESDQNTERIFLFRLWDTTMATAKRSTP